VPRERNLKKDVKGGKAGKAPNRRKESGRLNMEKKIIKTTRERGGWHPRVDGPRTQTRIGVGFLFKKERQERPMAGNFHEPPINHHQPESKKGGAKIVLGTSLRAGKGGKGSYETRWHHRKGGRWKGQIKWQILGEKKEGKRRAGQTTNPSGKRRGTNQGKQKKKKKKTQKGRETIITTVNKTLWGGWGSQE